ncbi:hypothetical protein [Actinomadura vinacea]|uniref:hypothetical protein n=1 Tax=Actinomadura vinacea TaxID=115336 RepID=UPI0031D51D02
MNYGINMAAATHSPSGTQAQIAPQSEIIPTGHRITARDTPYAVAESRRMN